MTAITSNRPSSGVISHGTAGGISGDGRFLTFTTQDTTFVDPDTNGFFEDAWLVDRQTGEEVLVGVNDAGEQGNDGNFAGDVSDNGPLRDVRLALDESRRADEPPRERLSA